VGARGGNTKLIKRLKETDIRARIRNELLTPGHGWDNVWQQIPSPEAVLVAVVQNPELASLQGKRLAEVAAIWNQDPIDAMCELLIKDKAFTRVAIFGMSEPDVVLALQQPWVSVNNDSQGTAPEGILGEEHPHPRAYGTFPRILRKYVRDEHALTFGGCHPQGSRFAAQQMRLHRSWSASSGECGRMCHLRS